MLDSCHVKNTMASVCSIFQNITLPYFCSEKNLVGGQEQPNSMHRGRHHWTRLGKGGKEGLDLGKAGKG